MIALAAICVVTLGAVGLGAYGVRLARTTSDLYVASRAVTPWWNAAAIGGEYLSAASFLGIAGLTMKFGASALWLPVGFTAGYLALLLFVAAPLRRFGSYTIPDFAQARLGSRRLRTLAAVVVLAIGGLYLVPQLKGAGLTLFEVVGAPYWVGIAVVAAVVALTVSLGGMRGITYVQAYQYWVKTFAIALPACVLLVVLGGLPEQAAIFGDELPRAPEGGLVVELDQPKTATFPEAATVTVDGVAVSAGEGAERVLGPGRVEVPEGVAVPVATGAPPERGAQWATPVGGAGQDSTLAVYSLLLATFLGTMGLPHILVRFYTNPDGAASRSTTVRVLGLLGLFYLFPAVYAALGRVLTPELYLSGRTDAVVLRLPEAAIDGLGGELLGALVAAGAFAAFMSTASGLLVSLAGTLSYDLRRTADRRRAFRRAAATSMLVPAALALGARDLDLSLMVGWAFALAASTFCPLFLLGIWWRGLTAQGAAAGMVVGTVLTLGAVLASLAVGQDAGLVPTLLAQPAVMTVPLSFLTMIAVSLLGPHPAVDVRAQMLALHAPEELRPQEAPA